MAAVPRMQDNTQVEKEFEKYNTFRGLWLYNSKWLWIYAVFSLLATLGGILAVIIGIWALVECTVFYPITTEASNSMIVLSILIIIVGGVMAALNIGCVFFVKYERPSASNCYNGESMYAEAKAMMFMGIMFFLGTALIVFGSIAGALIPSISESTETSVIVSLQSFQQAKDAWNAAQSSLRCCGAVYFSDYEQVFNNFSVPVSCCNTTNPLVNETTCPDIVRYTNVTVTTDPIYTEGCVPQLVSYFHHIHSVIAGVSAIIGAFLVISVGIWAVIVRLGSMLAYTQMDEESQTLLKTHSKLFEVFGGVYRVVYS